MVLRGLMIILVLLIAAFCFVFMNLGESYVSTYTLAICEGNVCRDYLFTCQNGEIIDSSPISGFVAFDGDWVDARENRDLC